MLIMALCFVAAFLGCCGILAVSCLVELATSKEESVSELLWSCVFLAVESAKESNHE